MRYAPPGECSKPRHVGQRPVRRSWSCKPLHNVTRIDRREAFAKQSQAGWIRGLSTLGRRWSCQPFDARQSGRRHHATRNDERVPTTDAVDGTRPIHNDHVRNPSRNRPQNTNRPRASSRLPSRTPTSPGNHTNNSQPTVHSNIRCRKRRRRPRFRRRNIQVCSLHPRNRHQRCKRAHKSDSAMANWAESCR
jgi:hypothetical protein